MLDGRIWLKRPGLLVALLMICGNFAFSVPSTSAAPDVVNYQSRLRDILGNPVVASTTIQFSIYNHATNGAPTDATSETGPLLWTETYDQGVGACAEVAPDTQGYFDVQLGNCVSFPDYLDFQETLYLGVKIEADAEASPRVLLAAHPFAMNAGRVGPFADSGSDELVGEALGTATAVTQGYNSPMLVLQGSGWTGAAADERELKVLNTVTDADNYQLSILNHNDVEIFSLDSTGLLGIGNDSPATALHVDSNDANTVAIVTLENTAGDMQIFRSDATPESSITGSVGDLTIDSTNGAMYLKTSGAGTNTGWESFVTESDVSVLAGNGLTLNSGVIDLGGDLDQDTYINHQGFSFVLREFAGEPYSEFNGDNFKIINTTTSREVRFGVSSVDTAGVTWTGTNDHNLFYRDDYILISSDAANFEGLTYAADYSADYTTRSLVDKAYVDSVAGGGGGGTLDASYDFGGAGVGRSIVADSGAVYISDAGQTEPWSTSEGVLKIGSSIGTSTFESFPSALLINADPGVGEYAVGLSVIGNERSIPINTAYELLTEAVSLSGDTITFTTNLRTLNITESASTMFMVTGSTSDDGMYQLLSLDPSGTVATVRTMAGGNPGFPAEAAASDVIEGIVSIGNGLAQRALEVTQGKDATGPAIKIRNYSLGSSLQVTHDNSSATEPAIDLGNDASDAPGIEFSGTSTYSITFDDISTNYFVMGDSNDMGTTSTGGLMADPYGVSPTFAAVGYGVVGYYNYVGAADAGNNLAGSVTYSSNANHLTGSPTRWAVTGAFESDESGNVEARVLATVEPGGGTNDAEAVMEASHEDNGGDAFVHIEAHKRGGGNVGDAYVQISAEVDDTGTMDSWISFQDENDTLTFTQYGSSLGDDLLNAPGEVFSASGTIGGAIGGGEDSTSLVHALNAVGTYAAGLGAGGGGTLDQAYDFGGAGNGRTVTSDSGTIQFTTPDGSNHSVLTVTQNDVTNDPTALLIENAGDGAAIEFSGAGGQSIVTDLATNWITIANTVDVDDTIEAGFILDPYGNNPMYAGLGEGAVGMASYVGAVETGNSFQLTSLQAMNDWPLNSPTRSAYIYLWETDSDSGDVKAEMVAEVASGGDDDAIVDIKAINEDVNHNAYAGLSSTMDSGGNGNAYTAIQARVLSGTGDGFISFTDSRDDLLFAEDSAFFGDDLLNAAGEIFEATGTIGSISGETSDSLVHALNAVGTYAAGLGAGAGGTLDQAYDFGGAGAGRLITADSGSVLINVPDTSNTAALTITSNDTTNYPASIDFGSDYGAIVNDYVGGGWSTYGDGAQFVDLTTGLFIDPYGNDPALGGSQGFSGIMNFVGAATAGVGTQQLVFNNSDDDFFGTITRYSRIILNETDQTGDVSIDFDARTTSAATGDSDMTFNVISATPTGDAEFLVGANKSSGTSGESTVLLQAINSIADDATITLNAAAGGTSTIQLLSADGDIYFVDERENNLFLTQDSVALGGDLLNSSGEIFASNGAIGSSFSETSLSLIHAINAVGTYAAGIGAGAGGTLDMAYDFGGSGVGRVITADSDEVQIIVPDGSGNVGLDIVQNDTTIDSSVLQLTNNTDAAAAIEFAGTGPQVLDADLTTNYFMISDDVDLSSTTGGFIYDPYGNESNFAASDIGIAGLYNFVSSATSGRESQGSAIYASDQNYFLGTPTRSSTIAAFEDDGSNNDVATQIYAEIASGGGTDDALTHIRARHEENGGNAYAWIEADKVGAGNVGNAYITISATTDLDPSQRSWIEFEDDNESLNFTQYSSALGDDLLNSAGEIFSSTGTLGSVIGAGGETSTSLVHALNSLGNYVVNFGGGGGGTLDASYDTGGAGAGRLITADSGAVQITVPDTSDNAALTILQNDVTNNPPSIDFGATVAYLNTDYAGGGYTMVGDSDDIMTIDAGFIVDPYGNEPNMGGFQGLTGFFNFVDPDAAGLGQEIIALHTSDAGLSGSATRQAQFLLIDGGDSGNVQAQLNLSAANGTNSGTSFDVNVTNDSDTQSAQYSLDVEKDGGTTGEATAVINVSDTSSSGNATYEVIVESDNGNARLMLDASTAGATADGYILFRDTKEDALFLSQISATLGGDLLNDPGELFSDTGTIGSTIGAGETSISIVHALNSLATYTTALGVGSSYWDRTGTTLSPATSGDNVTVDGSLTIGDGALGSANLYWVTSGTGAQTEYDGAINTLDHYIEGEQVMRLARASGISQIGDAWGAGNGTNLGIDDGNNRIAIWADEVVYRDDAVVGWGGGGTDTYITGNTSTNIIELVADSSIAYDTPTIDYSNQTIDVTLNAAVDALNFDSSTLSIDAVSNFVGIGTASPLAKLDVDNTIIASNTSERIGYNLDMDIFGVTDIQRQDIYGFKGVVDTTGSARLDGAGVEGWGMYIDVTGVDVLNGAEKFAAEFIGAAVNVGDDTNQDYMDGTGDLYVADDLEVDGQIYTSAVDVRVSGSLTPYSDAYMVMQNTAGNAALQILSSTNGYGYVLFGDGDGADGYMGEIQYNHSTDAMHFLTNGAYQMSIDSTGQVGIGVNAPDSLLHIQDDVNGDVLFTIENESTGIDAMAGIALTNDTGEMGSLGVLGSNYSASHLADAVILRSDAAANGIAIGSESTDPIVFFMNNFAASSEVARIDSSGRLGIGTTSPNAFLDIEQAEGVELIRLSDETNTDSVGVYTGDGSPEGVVAAQLGSIYFDNDATTDTTGGAYLKTAGDGLNNGWSMITTGTLALGFTQGSVGFANASGDLTEDNTNFFWDDTNNRLGIGTNTPTDDLEIDGDVYISGGDLKTDRWLDQASNVFIGEGVGGAGNLSHAAGDEGYYNTAVGGSALYTVTNGQYNTAIGAEALYSVSTGDNNTAVGASALRTNTGLNNTAVGVQALYDNIGGSSNTALGVNAGTNTTTGNYNTLIGEGTLQNNETGSNNTVLGYRAAQGSTVNSLANNTIIGFQAGNVLTTGSNNILLGYQAGDNLTTGSSNIIIGYDIDAGSATGTNQLNIAGTIYGDLSAGIIGIGDSDPTNGGLVVADGVVIGGDSTDNLIDDATNGAGSTTLYIGQNTIDTTAPSDERLKRDITATELSLEDLMAIEIVDFRYSSFFTDDDEEYHHGVIAQQVEDIYPYAVTTRSDGYKMVDYKSFIPLIMKSIQDQQGVMDSIQSVMGGLQEAEAEVQGSDASQALSMSLSGLVVSNNAIFEGNIVVQKHLNVAKDTAGRAIILAGDIKVDVEFDDEYAYQPIVVATLRSDHDIPGYWWVSEESSIGFTINLDGTLPYEVEFNWVAMGVDEGKIFVSDSSIREIELYVKDGGPAVDIPVVDFSEPEEEEVVEEEPVDDESVEEDPVIDSEEDPVVEEPVEETPVEEELVVEDELIEEDVQVEEDPIVEQELIEEAPIEEDSIVEEPIESETIIEE